MYVRKLRSEQNISLSAFAKAIGYSSPYLSSLEHGKKGKPSNKLIKQIINHYSLTPDQSYELISAAQQSSSVFAVPKNAGTKLYEVAFLLSKFGDELSDKELDIIKYLLSHGKKKEVMTENHDVGLVSGF